MTSSGSSRARPKPGSSSSGLSDGLDLDDDSVAERASALEFALEGLHLTKQLNKEQTESPGRWRFQSDL